MSMITRSMVLWVPDWPILASLRVAPLPVITAATDVPLALIEKGLVFACSAAARI
jgi:protein ImuB